jgi:Golgi phosphoprotein 3 GPP34
MDAETPKAVELSLPQAFLLLATNDKDGKPEVPVFALRTTTAGAILAELALLGAIELQGKHIRATDAAPRTDFLQELELIRGKSRPHTPKAWVAILEGRAEVRRIYEGMASRGIVEHVGEKHLGRFRAVRYPEKDHAPEEALLKKIQATLTGALSDPEASASKGQGTRCRGTRSCEAWCPGARCQDHSTDRTASGGRTVREALPGG